MRQMWIQMPDSIVPYLNESNRTELADYVDMGEEAVLQNQLKDTTRLVVLQRDYIDVRLSAASRLQMKLLPWNGGVTDGDSLLCMVFTHYGPSAESRLSFYDRQWKPLDITAPLPSEYASATAVDGFLQRPDSISEADLQDITAPLMPRLLAMELSPTEPTLTLSLSLPPMSREEEARLNPLLLQRKLNWNGQRFK